MEGRRIRLRTIGGAAAAAFVLALLPAATAAANPPWLSGAQIVVHSDLQNQDCRTGVCKHNENTDLIRWHDAIYFVHRTAGSQILGPNSSLRVYRSRDDGKTFQLQAIIPAPTDRDIRDPAFYTVGKRLFIKAITRLPGFGIRDQGVGSISIETNSSDGKHWSKQHAIGPEDWGFWRVVRRDGVYYSAAYEDGDLRVVLYRSTDGRNWTKGPLIYGVSEDTPLETELSFSLETHRMLGLVRMDGNDHDYLGNQGRLRTKVCWAKAPSYDKFSCPQTLHGVRLDGAV